MYNSTSTTLRPIYFQQAQKAPIALSMLLSYVFTQETINKEQTFSWADSTTNNPIQQELIEELEIYSRILSISKYKNDISLSHYVEETGLFMNSSLFIASSDHALAMKNSLIQSRKSLLETVHSASLWVEIQKEITPHISQFVIPSRFVKKSEIKENIQKLIEDMETFIFWDKVLK